MQVESYLELYENDGANINGGVDVEVYDYGEEYLVAINGELYFMRQLNYTNNSKVVVRDLGLAKKFDFSVDTLERNQNKVIDVNKTQQKTGEDRKKLPDCILKEIVDRIKGIELADYIKKGL